MSFVDGVLHRYPGDIRPSGDVMLEIEDAVQYVVPTEQLGASFIEYYLDNPVALARHSKFSGNCSVTQPGMEVPPGVRLVKTYNLLHPASLHLQELEGVTVYGAHYVLEVTERQPLKQYEQAVAHLAAVRCTVQLEAAAGPYKLPEDFTPGDGTMVYVLDGLASYSQKMLQQGDQMAAATAAAFCETMCAARLTFSDVLNSPFLLHLAVEALSSWEPPDEEEGYVSGVYHALRQLRDRLQQQQQ